VHLSQTIQADARRAENTRLARRMDARSTAIADVLSKTTKNLIQTQKKGNNYVIR